MYHTCLLVYITTYHTCLLIYITVYHTCLLIYIYISQYIYITICLFIYITIYHGCLLVLFNTIIITISWKFRIAQMSSRRTKHAYSLRCRSVTSKVEKLNSSQQVRLLITSIIFVRANFEEKGIMIFILYIFQTHITRHFYLQNDEDLAH